MLNIKSMDTLRKFLLKKFISTERNTQGIGEEIQMDTH